MQPASEQLKILMAEAYQLKVKMDKLKTSAPHLAPSIDPVIFGIIEGTIQKPSKI